MQKKFTLALLWTGCLTVGVLTGLAFAKSAAAAAAPPPARPGITAPQPGAQKPRTPPTLTAAPNRRSKAVKSAPAATGAKPATTAKSASVKSGTKTPAKPGTPATIAPDNRATGRKAP